MLWSFWKSYKINFYQDEKKYRLNIFENWVMSFDDNVVLYFKLQITITIIDTFISRNKTKQIFLT